MRKQALIAAAVCGAMGLSLFACVPDVQKEEPTSTEVSSNKLFQDKNATVEEVTEGIWCNCPRTMRRQ